jgi:hypothetical protein
MPPSPSKLYNVGKEDGGFPKKLILLIGPPIKWWIVWIILKKWMVVL